MGDVWGKHAPRPRGRWGCLRHMCSPSWTQFFHGIFTYIVAEKYLHGSHRDWKSGKTWKNGKAFSSQGKVREFCQDWKSQGILPKILEKQENLNKKNVFVKVREFYTKCWKISGFEKITVSRSYLILFSQTSQGSWHLFL